ncbi:hypothetical protein [Micropruina sp.]|uniref:hypothetical protein n=1 Tax=Micropruina sp. TaxID=2737536 RepID=UPI0039E2673B
MTETLFTRLDTRLSLQTPITRAEPVTALRSAKWLDPHLGELLAQIKPQPGLPRTQQTVPIAPSDALDDAMLFEAPANPGQRFYLPRYSLATQLTDRGTQVRVRLTRQDPGARISVVVQTSMPPELAAVAPDATPLAHEVTGVLSFEVPGGGMKREWVCTDRHDLPDGIELSVVVPTVSDLGEVYNALTDASAGCSFTVRRTITVAIPTGTAPVEQGQRPRFPVDVPVHVPPVTGDSGVVEPEVVNWRRPPIRIPLHQPSIEQPEGAIAGVRLASHTLRPGGPRWHPIDEDPGPQTSPGETLFRATTRSLDQMLTPTPFVFSKDLHPYIYGDITGAGTQGGLVLEQIAFGDRHHSYYFAADRPEVAYYLPDAFKLARTPEAPHPPMMSVTFDSSDGTAATTSTTVVFAASAVASPARLLDAATQLAARAGVAAPAMELQPFMADSSRLTLRVSLPGAAGSSTVLEDARIDLRTALSAGFKLPLAAFQSMFDRLNGADPRLFDGEVEVRLDRPDRAAEKVPVVVNMADLAGALVDVTPVRQPADPRYQVTIANAIESPVRLDTLVARLPQSTGPLAAALQPSPAGETLAPGGSLTATVTPERTPDEPEVLPEVSVVDATVTPDAGALWDAICDDTTSYLTREVTVKAPAQLFTPGDDGSRILALVIELGGLTGGLTKTVELSAETLSALATINAPIADLVLRTTDPGQYRYRVSTVRADRVTDGQWHERSAEILWIVSADVT